MLTVTYNAGSIFATNIMMEAMLSGAQRGSTAGGPLELERDAVLRHDAQ